MTEHLSNTILNALADDELSPERLVTVQQHLDACHSCTAMALQQSLFKSATARAGQRYTPSTEFQMRLAAQIRSNPSVPESSKSPKEGSSRAGIGFYGWATACALLLIIATAPLIQNISKRSLPVKAEFAAITTEALDQHIAALATTSLPQVISSDRHTVKPWFQGKLPFSFNLPENLPNGIVLEGANLTYIQNRPAAQLIYGIGKHRVSVYLQQISSASMRAGYSTEEYGFHLLGFSSGTIEGVAVSDADPARVAELVGLMSEAQKVSGVAAR